VALTPSPDTAALVGEARELLAGGLDLTMADEPFNDLEAEIESP
jgi:hypothetical protein